LPLFAFEYDVQAALHLLRRTPMELAVRIFEHVFASYVNREVVSSDSFVESFELLSEEPTFYVKVENARVIHEDRERSVSEVDGGLAENLVQNGSVLFWEQQEFKHEFEMRNLKIIAPGVKVLLYIKTRQDL